MPSQQTRDHTPARPEKSRSWSLMIQLHVIAFCVGAVVMGFEMLGSRYLYPYFGGSITTWAALISVVLTALMIGYFAGGVAADRWPSPIALAFALMGAAAYMALVPLAADSVFEVIFAQITNPALGALSAAAALSLFPLALLGSFTPFAIRLTLRATEKAGTTAGRLYALSTFGNIFGTLFTTFYLMPLLGSRAMTYYFALAALLCGLWVLALSPVYRRLRPVASLAALALLILFMGAAPESQAQQTSLVTKMKDPDAAYPEGPLFWKNTLYYGEMGADRVSFFTEQGEKRTFWQEEGCGPTALAPYRTGLLVLCHLSDEIVAVSEKGIAMQRWHSDRQGQKLLNPNDASADDQGGVYFTASGHFHAQAPRQGAVLYLDASGTLERLLTGLHYSNGLSVHGGQLYLSEHLGRRLLRFPILSPGTLGPATLLADFRQFPKGRFGYALAGPDGIEALPDGRFLVPEYGEGRFFVFNGNGAVTSFEAPFPFITNAAYHPQSQKIYLVGAYDNQTPPYPGAVVSFPLSALMP